MRRLAVYAWLHDHPRSVDTVLVVPLLLLSLWVAVGTGGVSLLAIFAAQVLPITWRRTHPGPVVAVVVVACLSQLVASEYPAPVNVAVLFVVYAGAAYGRPLTRWLTLLAGLVGAVLGMLRWVGPWSTAQESVPVITVVLVALAAIVLMSWALGDASQARRSELVALQERARILAAERDQQAEIAAAAERARIARELHDVVAHSISVVVVQADGARYAAARDPERAVRALATIADTSRAALAEMRRLLGVLREEDGDGLAPQPELSGVPALIDQVRSAGMTVELRGEEHLATTLSTGAQLALYRVAQEALTNVMRHAGPSPRVDVEVSQVQGSLHLRVQDDGRGAASLDDGQGQGIRGMIERISLYGGTVSAGPRVGGGFAVAAAVPLPPELPATPDPLQPRVTR